MSTDAKDLHGVFQRLGSPGHVAASAAQEFRKARFSQRHPVLMFVVLPVLALPVLWFAALTCIVLLMGALGIESGKVDTGGAGWRLANACLPYTVLALLVLPAAASAAFFARLANRAQVNWKWLAAASGMIAILGGLAAIEIILPTMHEQGRLTLGFSLSKHPSASQALQFLLPLAICGWAIWRQMKSGRQMMHA